MRQTMVRKRTTSREKQPPNQSHPYGVRQPLCLSHIIHAIIAVRMPEDVLRDMNAPFSTSATPLEGNKILCAVTSSKPPAKEKLEIPTKKSHW